MFRLAVLLLVPFLLPAFPLRFVPDNSNYIARGVSLTPTGPIFTPGIRFALAGARWSAPVPEAAPVAFTHLFAAGSASRRIPHYIAIRYRALLPGIDLSFHGSPSGLEYDFVLAPGADPRAIRMRFPDRLAALQGGDLVVGPLRHRRPLAWQDTASGRRYIEASYRLSAGEVTFSLGTYDRLLPLTIDPVLAWSTFAGGPGAESGRAVAVDTAGNVYLGGSADSSGGPRGFVERLDPGGASVIDSLEFAGCTVNALALDASGAVVVAGSIVSTAFPAATAGAVKQSNPTGFVARLTTDASGFKLGFLAQIAANPSAVALDPTGAVYLTGTAQSANGGGKDAFAMKLSADGSRVLYATNLGGSFEDAGRAIAVNVAGEAYVAGDTASSNFPITPGAAQSRFGGRVAGDFAAFGDGFVAKLDAAGTNLIFSTYLGGTAPDVAWGIAVDKDGAAYVVGGTQSSDFPVTAGSYQSKYAGGTSPASAADPAGDAFVTKFSAVGARIWSTFLGGSSREAAAAIALDSAGDLFVAGSSESANFPWTADAVRGCRNGGPWVAQFDPAGTRLLRSSSIGGMGFDQANALAADSKGAVYLAGDTTSRPFFSSPAAAQRVYGGGDADAFLAKLDWLAAGRISVSCVLNAASFAAGNLGFYPQGTVAPGEVVSLFGSALGPDQPAIASPGTAYPTSLGGTQVLFDGIPAPVWYAGPNQINAVVPYSVKDPVTELTVRRNGGTDGPRLLPVAAAVPGIFTATGTGQGQAAVLNQDGTYNGPSNPAPRGSVIVFYAAGAGAMTPAQRDGDVQPLSLPLPKPVGDVAVQIRGSSADVVYAGAAPGYIAGLLQVNVRVPETIEFGNSVPLTLSIGGQASQLNVTIAVAR